MAISRIRGEQIRKGVLANNHIANDAAIEEGKLDINWAGHYQNTLETKKVIDYVQVGNKVVGEATEYNLTTNGIIVGGNVTSSLTTEEGVITDAPYNQVVIRDAMTGDAVIDEEGEEVYGRLVHDGVDFKVVFYSPGTDEEGKTIETPFTMPVNQEIDFQYMERFNLKTVSELFAANEKFVAGAADITAFQNIEQLAKDLYGAGYTLDRDGKGNLELSIQEQITKEIQERKEANEAIVTDLSTQAAAGKGANLIGVEDADNKFLGGTVEAVLAELKDAMDQFKTDLGSIENGKGASLIGVEDAQGYFEGTTVEEVLTELSERATNLEQGSNAEVDNAKGRDADTASGKFLIKDFATLEERLVEIETVVDEEAGDKEERTAALEKEVNDARGSEVSVEARLGKSLNDNGTLKVGTQIHSHYRARYQAVGGEGEVSLAMFNKADLPNFQVGDDSLEVFINGQLQEPGLNYLEGEAGNKVTFDLGDGTVLEPTDIVQIKYYVNNAE